MTEERKKRSNPVGVPRPFVREPTPPRGTPAPTTPYRDPAFIPVTQDPYDVGVLMSEMHETKVLAADASNCARDTANEMRELRISVADLQTRIVKVEGWTSGIPAAKWVIGIFLLAAVGGVFWLHRRGVEQEQLERRQAAHEALDQHAGTSKTLSHIERELTGMAKQLEAAREVDEAHRDEIRRRLDRIEARRGR